MKNKKNFFRIFLAVFLLMALTALHNHSYGQETVSDYDGNVYETVRIGEQLWMAGNLRTTRYMDGTPVHNGTVGDVYQESNENEEGAYTVYPHQRVQGIDSQSEMQQLYGNHYNFYAVADPRGLCPEGWRVPSREEWNEMINFLVNYYDDINRSSVAQVLKSRRQDGSPLGGEYNTNAHPRWDSDDSHHGTDRTGFSALPGGSLFGHGAGTGHGFQGSWWSSTETQTGAYVYSMHSYSSAVSVASNMSISKGSGMSVRCIKSN